MVLSVAMNRAALQQARLEAERLKSQAGKNVEKADAIRDQLEEIKQESQALNERQAEIDRRVKERDKIFQELEGRKSK